MTEEIDEVTDEIINDTTNEATDEVTDEIITNTNNRRLFRRYHENGKTSGYYQGKKPKQAASKIFTSICREMNKKDDDLLTDYKFAIVECTRGCKRKIYRYVGSREKIKEKDKKTRKIINNDTGKETSLNFKYKNIIYKDKDFKTTENGFRKKAKDMPKGDIYLARKKRARKPLPDDSLHVNTFEEIPLKEFKIPSPLIKKDRQMTFTTNIDVSNAKIKKSKKTKIIKKLVKKKNKHKK